MIMIMIKNNNNDNHNNNIKKYRLIFTDINYKKQNEDLLLEV